MRLQERERGCNPWASSIRIIYLEACKCSAGVLRLQLRQRQRGSDMFPRTFHSIDWLLAAWSRRPLVCQPVTKQKSPPMSSSAAPVWGRRLAEPWQSALNSPRRSSPRSIKPLLCGDTRLRTFRPARMHESTEEPNGWIYTEQRRMWETGN